MNIDQNAINTKLAQALQIARQNLLFIAIVTFGVIYAYIILQISSITASQPDQAKVDEQLKSVPRPTIDKEAAATIEGLESQGVNVQAIFDQARDNPFSE